MTPTKTNKVEIEIVPEVGRVVHFGGYNDGVLEPWPAIITRVRVDGQLDLHVMRPNEPCGSLNFVCPSTELRRGYWSWPPSVMHELARAMR